MKQCFLQEMKLFPLEVEVNKQASVVCSVALLSILRRSLRLILYEFYDYSVRGFLLIRYIFRMFPATSLCLRKQNLYFFIGSPCVLSLLLLVTLLFWFLLRFRSLVFTRLYLNALLLQTSLCSRVYSRSFWINSLSARTTYLNLSPICLLL